MPSRVFTEGIGHTNETVSATVDSSGNLVMAKDIKLPAAGGIKTSGGAVILNEAGGNVSLGDVRLPTSGGIKDSSGNNLVTESGGKTSINLTGDFVPSEPMMFRNKVINGGMKISQRGTSFSFAHDGTVSAYTLDRYKFQVAGTDEFDCTVSQYSMSAAELNATGHSKAFKLLTGTAESAIANDEMVNLQHKIEGQDVQDLQYGTASAKSMTLSFWVKSSITGTYAVSFYKDDASVPGQRIINRTYTINSANTWEKKTISIVGDTDSTGSIDDDNGEGFRIIWGFASGSTYDGSTSTSWTDYTNAHFLGGHAQDGVVTTAGADWYLTGVQLEIGSSATPFEHRPIGMEISLCQRYYYKSYNIDVAPGTATGTGAHWNVTTAGVGWVTFQFPVSMRATPTCTAYHVNGTAGQLHNQYNGAYTATSVQAVGQSGVTISGGTPSNQGNIGQITAEAEL